MPILRITRELLGRLADGDEVASDERGAYVHVARRHGCVEDAAAWLDAFLAAPASRGWLLSVVQAHGTQAHAATLYAACVAERGGVPRLADDAPSEVLRVLGYLRYARAVPVLWAHATAPSTDHTGIRHACLGLLDVPCETLAPEIARELSKYEGENQFPELLPSLASKTGNPLWLPRLVRWGRDRASTDCNGGIMLGIAMFGAAGLPALLDVLWEPQWEAHAGATGSRYWAWLATRVHALPMRELYAHARATPPGPARQQALRMIVALLEMWFEPVELHAAHLPAETARDLMSLLFWWSTPHADDSLIAHARAAFADHDDPLHDRIYELERSLRQRMQHDLETGELMTARGTE